MIDKKAERVLRTACRMISVAGEMLEDVSRSGDTSMSKEELESIRGDVKAASKKIDEAIQRIRNIIPDVLNNN